MRYRNGPILSLIRASLNILKLLSDQIMKCKDTCARYDLVSELYAGRPSYYHGLVLAQLPYIITGTESIQGINSYPVPIYYSFMEIQINALPKDISASISRTLNRNHAIHAV